MSDNDPSEIDLPDRSPIRDRHDYLELLHYSNINKQKVYKTKQILTNVLKLRLDSADMSVSDGACQSPMGLRIGMYVFDEACRGLRSGMSVYDGSLTGHG